MVVLALDTATCAVAALVAVAGPAVLAGLVPGPPEPLHLRRPDAVAPGARKPVTA